MPFEDSRLVGWFLLSLFFELGTTTQLPLTVSRERFPPFSDLCANAQAAISLFSYWYMMTCLSVALALEAESTLSNTSRPATRNE